MMENKEAEKKRDKQLLDQRGRIRKVSGTIKQNNIRRISGSQKRRKKRNRRYIGANYCG